MDLSDTSVIVASLTGHFRPVRRLKKKKKRVGNGPEHPHMASILDATMATSVIWNDFAHRVGPRKEIPVSLQVTGKSVPAGEIDD
jgi:hypothetical protein